jgi:hypothetical protein
MVRIFSTILLLFICSISSYSQSVLTETDSFYKRGELFKVIENDSVQIIVSLQEVRQFGHYYKLNISVVNKADRRMEIVPSDISGEYVHYKKKSTKRETAPSFSYEDYARKIKGHVSASEVFSAIGVGLRALSTAPTGTISYSDNSGNRAMVNVYDNVAKQAAIDTDMERSASYQMMKNEFADSEKDSYLLRETLFPQNAIWGYVMFRYKECHDFDISILLGETVYSFSWKLLSPQQEQIDRMTDDIYK